MRLSVLNNFHTETNPLNRTVYVPIIVGIMFIASMYFVGTGPSLCIFHSIVGYPCPGCGMTRAMRYLVMGDVRTAFVTNPNSIIAGPGLVIAGVHWILKTAWGVDVRIVINDTEKAIFIGCGILFFLAGFIYNLSYNPYL